MNWWQKDELFRKVMQVNWRIEFVKDRVLSVQRITLGAQQVGSPDSFHSAASQEEEKDIKGGHREEEDSFLTHQMHGPSQEHDHRLHYAMIRLGAFLP